MFIVDVNFIVVVPVPALATPTTVSTMFTFTLITPSQIIRVPIGWPSAHWIRAPRVRPSMMWAELVPVRE